MLTECPNISGKFEFLLPPEIQWDQGTFVGDAYPGYSWGVNIAEVEVDALTCEVAVKRVAAVFDIGTVINPVSASGQVEGGLTQALGYTIMEKLGTGKDGLYDAALADLHQPHHPRRAGFDVSFVEYPYSFAPPGAKGWVKSPWMARAGNRQRNSRRHWRRINQIPITPRSSIRPCADSKGTP